VWKYCNAAASPASKSASLARAVEKYFGREHLTPPVSAGIVFTKTSIGVP
jgi:hypothetical protein